MTDDTGSAVVAGRFVIINYGTEPSPIRREAIWWEENTPECSGSLRHVEARRDSYGHVKRQSYAVRLLKPLVASFSGLRVPVLVASIDYRTVVEVDFWESVRNGESVLVAIRVTARGAFARSLKKACL